MRRECVGRGLREMGVPSFTTTIVQQSFSWPADFCSYVNPSSAWTILGFIDTGYIKWKGLNCIMETTENVRMKVKDYSHRLE